MKTKLTIIAVLLSMTPAFANEIPGTRVLGQGAVCAEGQGKALEVNATTKQEWSYCFQREIIVITTPTPTPTPIVTSTPTPEPTQSTTNVEVITQPVIETATETSTVTTGSTTTTITPTPTPTPTPSMPVPPVIERSNVVEVNATTNVTTVREESIDEWLSRFFAGWSNWYIQLSLWLESMWFVNE